MKTGRQDVSIRLNNILLAIGLITAHALVWAGNSEETPLSDAISKLPDYSYAGYGFGETPLPQPEGKIVDVTEFGAAGRVAPSFITRGHCGHYPIRRRTGNSLTTWSRWTSGR